MEAWATRYVGLPFLERGDTIRGVNCLGLCRLVYKERLGIEISDYGDVGAMEFAAIARTVQTNAFQDPWITIWRSDTYEMLPRLEAFDGILMYARLREVACGQRAVVHMGIMLDNKHLLHVEKGIDSVIRPITHKTIRHRIFAVIRHKSLMETRP